MSHLKIDIEKCKFSPLQAVSPNKTEDIQRTRIELELLKKQGDKYSATSLAGIPSLPTVKANSEAKLTPMGKEPVNYGVTANELRTSYRKNH